MAASLNPGMRGRQILIGELAGTVGLANWHERLRPRAKFTARRSRGLSRKSGREELNASIRSVSPGLTKNRERLTPYCRDESQGRIEVDSGRRCGPSRPRPARRGSASPAATRHGGRRRNRRHGVVSRLRRTGCAGSRRARPACNRRRSTAPPQVSSRLFPRGRQAAPAARRRRTASLCERRSRAQDA